MGIEDFEKMINFYEKKNIDVEETVKSFDLVLTQTNDHTIRGNPELSRKVYDYWKEVRESRGGKRGLLRKYWKAADPMNNDPKVTFRRSKDEKRNLRRTRKYDEDYLKQVSVVADL